MNTGCRMLSVNWTKDLIRWSTKSRLNGRCRHIKVRKYFYVKLYGGVHPCSELIAKWFNNTDSDEEVYNECETWDFKRKRYAPLTCIVCLVYTPTLELCSIVLWQVYIFTRIIS